MTKAERKQLLSRLRDCETMFIRDRNATEKTSSRHFLVPESLFKAIKAALE